MTAPLFLVSSPDALSRETIRLDGSEGRHASTVRRIGVGERVDVADGAGRVCECVVTVAGRDHLELAVRGRYELPRPEPRFVVVQAVPKGDRGELAVELLTEVGADVVVPWQAARCVAVWSGQRADRAVARWRAHAREATKQARRAWLPDVTSVAPTEEVAALLATADLAVVLDSAAPTPLVQLDVPATGDVAVVVGPEGGIAESELAAFEAAGAVACRIGPTVLRTSTAGVAALVALLARTGRWDQSAESRGGAHGSAD